uniref:CSON003011 protein n=1 Tax=Culicoides sonorensis TaxID=179676 RepID=A0A336MKV8_CULSO
MLLFLFFRYKFNCKENFYWSNLCWRAATMSPDSTTLTTQANNGGIYGNSTTTTTMTNTYVRNRRNNRRQIGGVCNCLMPLIRFWGVITAIVLCGVGVDITVHRYTAGYFILAASGLIFLLEIKWIITLFVRLCTNNDYTSLCYQCWSCTGFFGGWRLAPPYIALGIALLMWPHRLWLSYVAGVQLIILALLRLCTIFKFKMRSTKEGDEDLLPQFDDSYEKCDTLSEILDDSMPAPGHSLEDEEPLDEI